MVLRRQGAQGSVQQPCLLPPVHMAAGEPCWCGTSCPCTVQLAGLLASAGGMASAACKQHSWVSSTRLPASSDGLGKSKRPTQLGALHRAAGKHCKPGLQHLVCPVSCTPWDGPPAAARYQKLSQPECTYETSDVLPSACDSASVSISSLLHWPSGLSLSAHFPLASRFI